MKKLALALSFTAASAVLGTPGRGSGANAADAQISEGPELERATDDWAIIRWTTNNVKGTALRYGVVHYGTDPRALGETAKSPNRWNAGLPYIIYRVRVNDLRPATTYYYRVESENALNVPEGPESGVYHFTTAFSP